MGTARKKTKTTAPAKKTTPKAKAAAPAQPPPFAVIKTTEKIREAKGGPKGRLYALLTKKGIKYKELITAAETAKVPEVKVKKWIPRWVGKGYITAE
jgi:hypothetical protein